MTSAPRKAASLALTLVCAVSGSACGPTLAAPPAPPPFARDAPPVAFDFTTTLDRDHPLVGRIWDVSRRTFVSREELEAAVAGAHVALLGEKHDNPDHHRLQAALLQAMVDRGRRPDVAMEMLDANQQSSVDEVARMHPGDVDAFFRAVAWDKTGWPPANEYAPIVRVALAKGLPILAANMPTAETRALVHGGLAALDSAEVTRLGLSEPLPEPLAASLRAELAESHCGMLPDEMLAPMALAQRGRDAEMAERIEAAGAAGAVLVAGTGHARKDRGVPRELARLGERSVVSVAFTEALHGETDPARYGAVWHADLPPFDYLWFTPRASDDDPCEGMRHAHAAQAPAKGP